jgi:hypothetical protein
VVLTDGMKGLRALLLTTTPMRPFSDQMRLLISMIPMMTVADKTMEQISVLGTGTGKSPMLLSSIPSDVVS